MQKIGEMGWNNPAGDYIFSEFFKDQNGQIYERNSVSQNEFVPYDMKKFVLVPSSFLIYRFYSSVPKGIQVVHCKGKIPVLAKSILHLLN